METTWFVVTVIMIGMYVVLDGFDFGAGMLHLWVAREDRERRQVLSAIGPYWDGNEVWLVATGGVLFLAFPRVLASGLSGLYLAVMMILWVLILRGVAIEFRSHSGDPLWRSFWDAGLTVASTLAALLLGIALGNLVRGVPLDGAGRFALPLFDSLVPRVPLGIIDSYTVLAGALAVVALLHHGALFLAWKTDGMVRTRSRRAAAVVLPLLLLFWGGATVATYSVVPELFDQLLVRPLAWLAVLGAATGLVVSGLARRAGRDLTALLGSGAFLLGVLGATGASIYPTMIRDVVEPTRSLTVFNSASGPTSLQAGLWWWPAALVLVIGYFVIVYRLHRGRIGVDDAEGYGHRR